MSKLMVKGVRFMYYNEEYMVVDDNNNDDGLKMVNLNRSYISTGDLNFWFNEHQKGLIKIISSPKPELKPAMKVRHENGTEYIIILSGNDLKLLSFPDCIMQVTTTESIQRMYDNDQLVIIEDD